MLRPLFWRLSSACHRSPSAARRLGATGVGEVQRRMMSSYAVSDESDRYDGASDASELVVASKRRNTAASHAKKTDGRAVEEIYQKKTQLEHILLRPDTYIGSVERQSQQMWVYDEAAGCMTQKSLSFVPGLFKIFDEILVNAADNKQRDASMDTLRVDIDKENGSISVYNNGQGIPIQMHKKEGVYVPELIFGQLLTSSNYDDKEKKVTGGRNGFGAKLCNIFSKEFVVETADSKSGQHYRQVFSANMSRRGEPKIKAWGREDFTRITFKPDFSKFGMEGFEADTEALFRKRVYDMCACATNVKVFLNGERLKVKNFKQYVELYLKKPAAEGDEGAAPPPTLVHEKVNERWEICAAVSDGQFQQVSLVNSINTYKGGTHVDHVAAQIVHALVEAVKKKSKDMASIKPFQVKNHLSLFVNCLIENPTFDSQTKENMTLRQSAFGSKCDVGEDFMKKLMKSGVLENIMTWAKFKQDQALKKTDGNKRSRLSGIAKLDDANNAGTRNGPKCTLILTEGDSAKALAVSGLSVVGRDNYGVFPLRGKLLNVREANASQIGANAEITALKQILGLQQNKQYESTESLRYGHVMIMTDQDHDGSHIKGLLINFLDHFWPSLLRLPGFLLEFITPIVKATKGRQEISFYTIPEYERWKADTADGRGWNIKYYKGLGTSTAADAKKYFQDMDTHRKTFSVATADERNLVDMAFNKKRADERKDWLKTCTPDTFMDHASSATISIGDFINKELILFSQADNVRSIPSVMDGLKPGQRKILFACFKRKLRGEIKVMQLAGYVSEHAAYHHGEQSLCQTIVGLAQNFVGSNNLNLLEPNGQFGTRLQGGKDAASPRYIFTALSPFARALFRPDDDALLRYLSDDGQSIEPAWYAPILPMVLVNGCEGIGTGWSTSVPSYNPGAIARNLLRLMRGEELEPLHPWYSGFRGTIEPVDAACTKYRVAGAFRKVDDTTLEISELPIGSWTQTYKEWLEGLLTGDASGNLGLRDYKEHHTDATVRFLLHLTESGMEAAEREGIEKRFRLSTTLALTNVVLFDAAGRIKRYGEGPNQILRDFFDIRLGLYQRRKEHLADLLTREWTVLDNKVRFIREIVEGRLVVQKRKKTELVAELKARGYHSMAEDKKADGTAAEEHRDEAEIDAAGPSGGFEYLLQMPIYALTLERIIQLESERAAKESALNALLARTPKDLWRQDLDEFLALWEAREASKNETLDRLAVSRIPGGATGSNDKSGAKRKTAGAATAAACTVTAAKKYVPVSSEDEEEDESEFTYGETEPESADDIEVYDIEPSKALMAEKAEKPGRKPVERKPPAAKRAKRAADPPKQVTDGPLDAFITRASKPTLPTVPMPVSLVDSEDDMDLPLPVRISRMLAKKSSHAVSAAPVAPKHIQSGDDGDMLPTVARAVSRPAVKGAAKPAASRAAAAPKARPRKRSPIVSDDEDASEEVSEAENDDVFELND